MLGKAGLQQSESKGDNIFKTSLLRLDPIRTPFSAGGELTAVASAKNLTKILPENFQKDFNLAKANSKQLDEEIADKKERAIHKSLVIMKRVSFWIMGAVLSGLSSDLKPFMELRKWVGDLIKNPYCYAWIP
nr:protein BPS1, chloroplastic-like [Ipomoea trifida]